jgi:hypothetical protein
MQHRLISAGTAVKGCEPDRILHGLCKVLPVSTGIVMDPGCFSTQTSVTSLLVSLFARPTLRRLVKPYTDNCGLAPMLVGKSEPS